MPTTIDESNVYTHLRDKAEAQLVAGTTQTAGHWTMGVDTLRLLHRLSGSPENAEDALKLLHELQVHQVELDLQNEEIAANEQELVEDLQLYRTLYDYAPMAFWVVDLNGIVIQGNLAAAELFEVGQEHLEGRCIATLLNPHSRPLLLDLLQRVAKSGTRGSCVAQTGGAEQGSRHLKFQATPAPELEHILLTCYEGGHAE